MKDDRLFWALCTAFHATPEEKWMPAERFWHPGEKEMFWREHVYAGGRLIPKIVDIWTRVGKWPESDARTTYFLRLRIHRAIQEVESRREEGSSWASHKGQELGIEDRLAIQDLLLSATHAEADQRWVAEACEHGTLFEVYVPLPR